MSRIIKNVAESKNRKLLHISQTNGLNFNNLQRRYLQERFLYRISVSRFRDNFILKGGLLLVVVDFPSSRPTMDIDFLVKNISRNQENISAVFKEICDIDSNDGIKFDSQSVETSEIEKDGDYNGVRVRFTATMGTSKTVLSIDLGFNDILIPSPRKISFPVILNEEHPQLNAYCIETIIAEKFEAITKLALTNSRMKDFYDLYLILSNNALDMNILKESIKATFQHRRTAIVYTPIAFTATFYSDKNKQIQWKSFLSKRNIKDVPEDLSVVVKYLKSTLQPIIKEIQQN